MVKTTTPPNLLDLANLLRLGLENFCTDINFMLKRTVGVYWRLCWGIFTPVVLILVFLYFVSTLKRIEYEGKPYPDVVLGKNKIIYTSQSHHPMFQGSVGRCWASA